MLLLGSSSWLCAYLSEIPYLERASVRLLYASFVLNGLLGFSVFLFFVLLRPEAVLAWRQCSAKKSLGSGRQRVAGRASLKTTTVKGDADYTLVGDGVPGSSSDPHTRIQDPYGTYGPSGSKHHEHHQHSFHHGNRNIERNISPRTSSPPREYPVTGNGQTYYRVLDSDGSSSGSPCGGGGSSALKGNRTMPRDKMKHATAAPSRGRAVSGDHVDGLINTRV